VRVGGGVPSFVDRRRRRADTFWRRGGVAEIAAAARRTGPLYVARTGSAHCALTDNVAERLKKDKIDLDTPRF